MNNEHYAWFSYGIIISATTLITLTTYLTTKNPKTKQKLDSLKNRLTKNPNPQ
jgi:hypothetical protein